MPCAHHKVSHIPLYCFLVVPCVGHPVLGFCELYVHACGLPVILMCLSVIFVWLVIGGHIVYSLFCVVYTI